MRMGRIRLEETASTRAKILEDVQLGFRTLRYDLLRVLEGGGDRVLPEVHRNALPDEKQGAHQCSRQQDPQQGACQINPKVAERLGVLSAKSADERNTDG